MQLIDKDLLSMQEVRELVEAAKEAQQELARMDQAQVDRIVRAIADAGVRNARRLAQMANEDTGFGIVDDKVIKNIFASRGVYEHIKDMKTIGEISRDDAKRLRTIAVPVGVIAGLIPSTNPTSTALYKAEIAIKAGNAIVFSPHPTALRCILETVKVIRQAVAEAGGNENLVSCITIPTMEATDNLMRHRDVAMILATGGFGHNDAMMAYYLPWIHDIIDRYDVTYGHTDIKANYANTGDGQQMGMWIGAQMEPGPLGSMAHGDFGKLGPDAFLQLNAQGIRFHNEDQTNDHYGAQFVRQPGPIYMVIDSDWAEQLPAMQGGLGCVRSASDTLKESIDEWTAGKGDTIEELADALGLDADAKANFVASVERYNELCDKGVDEDFGKSPLRMFALRKAPFYAIKDEGSLRFLVTLGGLRTNANAQVLDNSFQVIPGLYAIGNTQGGRFVGDYPTTIAGASHSIACTYGYLTGKFIAEQG